MKIGSGSKFKVLAGACGLLLALALILGTAVPVLSAGVPAYHQFWGSVTIESAPAPEGTTVEAKIGGVVYGTTTVDADGHYGYVPNFYVLATTDQLGDEIIFYVAGMEAGNATFESGGTTPKDLAIGAVVQYTLNVSSTDGGNVTEPSEGNHTYFAGGNVTLVAVAETDFHFGNWTGNVSTVADVNAAETYIIMNGNYTIVANFVAGPAPTPTPTGEPTATPTVEPTATPTVAPTATPTVAPTATPTVAPTATPTVAPTAPPTQPPGGGGGGGGVLPTPTPIRTPTPAPTTPPGPTPTIAPPTIPAPTPIAIPGNGTTTLPINYNVLNGQAVLTIGAGTSVKTATGGPLGSISVAEVCFNIPKPECVIGCAYDYTPNGATFNPPATLTLKYDPGLVPSGVDVSKLVIAYYDGSKWVGLPSTVNTVNHTVTSTQVSHFTLFAVYSCAPVVTPTPTGTPVITAPPTPTPTPEEGKGTNIGVIIGPIIAVIVIAAVAFWLWRRRKASAPK